MTKRNKVFRIAFLLFVLSMVSTVMISGTFAKYTSEWVGHDTALVARWSFTSDDIDGTSDEPAILEIWNHEYVTNIYEKTPDNGDVQGDYLIAPGVEGNFTVAFSYDADVDADITFNFEKSGDASSAVPIQYSLDEDFTTIYYDIEELEKDLMDNPTIVTDSTSTITETGDTGTYVVTDTATADDGKENPSDIVISQTVYWKWPYDVSEHNALTAADAGVAADRDAAGFAGTGDPIKFPAGGENTDFNAWIDADDTAIGNSFVGLTRDSYLLKLTITATQQEPDEI